MKITTCSASLFLIFYASSAIANTTPLVLMSDADGKKWVSVYSDAFKNVSELIQLAQQDKKIISIARIYDSVIVAKSDDKGATWTTVYPYVTAFTPVGISANDKGIVLGGNTQQNYAYINNSVDGNSWSRSYPSFSYDCETLQKVTGFGANSSTILVSGMCLSFNQSTGQSYSRATLFASNDGAATSWQIINNLPKEISQSGAIINSVQWIKDKWFLLATTASRQQIILTSMDMKEWMLINVPNEVKTLTGMAANGDEWIAIGSNINDEPIAIRSLDQGKHWTLQNHFAKEETFKQIRYSGNWIIVGKSGDKETRPLMLRSQDGMTWESIELPVKIAAPSVASTLNDIIWTGEKWIAVGAYDDTKVGCKSLRNLKWKGKLQSASNTISVSDFSAWSFGKTQDGITYEANGYIDYTGGEGGQFGFGTFDGTCVEQTDGKTVNLNLTFNGRSINATLDTSDKNTVNITSTCLPDEHTTCSSFIGTLALLSS